MHGRRYIGGPWKAVIYHRFPKIGIVCDVQTHFILSADVGRGPKPDVADFRPLLTAALARVRIERIAADAGFDSEANHAFARDDCHVRSIIPAKHGRPTTKLASGRYRRLMQSRFDFAADRDRVQVETVMSMLKRRLEGFVRGRNAWTQRRELRLKVVTRNRMLLSEIEVNCRALPTPCSWRLGGKISQVMAQRARSLPPATAALVVPWGFLRIASLLRLSHKASNRT